MRVPHMYHMSTGMDTLSGEVAFVSAIFKQALKDARSLQPHIRTDARRFLQDDWAVAFWATLVGLDVEYMQQQIVRYLENRGG
jgi:hypothetical protein